MGGIFMTSYFLCLCTERVYDI